MLTGTFFPGFGVGDLRKQALVGVSDIFYFFSARGGGRGSPRCRGGGGGRFFIKNSGGGWEGLRGRRIGELFGGGGAKLIFFFGAEMSTRKRV